VRWENDIALGEFIDGTLSGQRLDEFEVRLLESSDLRQEVRVRLAWLMGWSYLQAVGIRSL